MKICKTKLLNIFINFVLIVFVFIYGSIFDYDCALKTGIEDISALCIVVYIWIMLSAYIVSKSLNLYIVFILVSIPFYMGDQLSLILGYENLMHDSDHSILDGIIAAQYIFDAMFFLAYSLLFFHMGYLLSYRCEKNVVYGLVKQYNSFFHSMKRVSKIMYFVTVFPAVIIRVYDILMSIHLGHLTYRLTKNYSLFFYMLDYLADWFLPACLMMLITSLSRKSKCISICSIVIYSLLYMFSGNRFEVVGVFFAVLTISIYWFRMKISFKNLIKISIFVVLLISMFQLIGHTRNIAGGVGMFSLNNIVSLAQENYVYKIFETTGNTFTSIANTIKCVPQYIDYNYGKSFLGAILYIFPACIRDLFMGGIITHISSVLSPYYYGWSISGYGSSFITEAYFNFGYMGCVVIFVYGMLFARIINIVEVSDYNRPFIFYFAIFMVSECFLAIRNDLYFIPRHIFLYVFIPYVFIYVLNIMKLKNVNFIMVDDI